MFSKLSSRAGKGHEIPQSSHLCNLNNDLGVANKTFKGQGEHLDLAACLVLGLS